MTNLHGYAGKILRVDLSSGSITHMPTMDYASRFLGGMGVAASIYFNEVAPEVKAFDPANRLIFMNGPLAGFPGLSSSRWVISGKSPTTNPEQFATTNLGGRWGVQLKFAGFDGVIVQGRSDRPVYLFIENGVVRIEDAARLWGKGAVRTREMLKRELGDKVAVAACGPAGENRVVFASILADNDASGSNGFGAVMGSKNLKAIAVAGDRKPVAAQPERLIELRKYVAGLRQGYLPWAPPGPRAAEKRKDPCYGCAGPCHRVVRTLADGTVHKAFCGPSLVYPAIASTYYGEKIKEKPASDVPMQAVMLTDDLGLDWHSLINHIQWLAASRQSGILNDENTGLPLSKFGSWEFLEALLKKIAFREGFGDILAQGIWRAGDLVGGPAKELLYALSRGAVGQDGRVLAYDPRCFPAHGLLVAMQPTRPLEQLQEMGHSSLLWLHTIDETFDGDGYPAGKEGYYVTSEVYRRVAERFWGSELAADSSTYDGKALAAKKIQDRSYVRDSMVFCAGHWPILLVSSGDHVGDPTAESKVFSAVTGNEADKEELRLAGERIANVRRAITVRERGGRESDALPENMFTSGLTATARNPKLLAPGKDGEAISVKGAVVDREKFERMKDEYYRLRGWDVATGLQMRATLEELGLGDVARGLSQRGLLVETALSES